MQFRRLGHTVLNVSRIGLGGGGIGQLFGPTTDEECIRTVRGAFDLGVNFFDVAPGYGNGKAEQMLAEGLAGVRKQVYIATKIMFLREHMADPFDAIAGSVEQSLRDLGTDYIDLFQLHNAVFDSGGPGFPNPGHILAPGGILEALKKVKLQGKVRFLGLTGFGDTDAIRELITSNEFDTIQTHYNILEQGARGQDYQRINRVELKVPPLMPYAKAHGVGMIGIRPYAAGALTAALDRPPNHLGKEQGEDLTKDIERSKTLLFLVKENGISLSQAAMIFVLSNEDIATVIPGCKNVKEIEEAVSCLDKSCLPVSDIRRIDNLYRNKFGVN